MATFEESLTRLEAVVERLEHGDLPLEESVRLFEEGMKLSGVCRKELDRADGRVQVLVGEKRGKIQLAQMDVGEPDATDELLIDEEEE